MALKSFIPHQESNLTLLNTIVNIQIDPPMHIAAFAGFLLPNDTMRVTNIQKSSRVVSRKRHVCLLKFSDELREALDISRRDIPLHIYRMRSLGYPPGWLLKARTERLPSFDAEREYEIGHEGM